MSPFSPESLLRSHDFQLATNPLVGEDSPDSRECLLWEDDFGPLTISRVDRSGCSFYRLRLGEEVAVDVMPDNRLSVSPGPGAQQATVDHFLADQVFPRILSQRGELVLHAGALNRGDDAVLLLGPSGSGKSTLAASFAQAGAVLMGDDAVVLSQDHGRVAARAVYPSLRLFPDSIEALMPADITSRDMAQYSDKRRIDLPIRTIQPGSAPVRAMFILGGEGPLDIRRMSAAQACMTIVENSFALDPTDREQASRRLERATRLALAVPTFALTYPREFDRLTEVKTAILSAVADDPCLRH